MTKIKKDKRYHYFYKITNKINNKFYYGIHSTNNIKDGYMGSGTSLKNAIKKYGIENFEKEIIQFFNSREELSEYEKDFVNENLIHDKNCYNVSCGGDKWKTIGTISVIDSSGNRFRCDQNDPNWISGKYKTATSNTVVVFDKDKDQYKCIDRDEYINHKESYRCVASDRVVVKNDSGDSYHFISKEDYDKNKHLYKTATSKKVSVIDKEGKTLSIDKDDPRYKNSDCVFIWCGRNHTEETKIKQKETFKKIGHQKGEKNSHYGTHWMNKDGVEVPVKNEDVEKYIKDGYAFGRIKKDKKDTYIYAYVDLVCPECGKTFKFRKISIKKDHLYFCSNECRRYYKIRNGIIKDNHRCADTKVNIKSFSYDDDKNHLSTETRTKIRKTMTPENSKNKRVWVSKLGVTKYIRKELLNEYILDGWELGRKNYKPISGNQGRKIIIV